MRKNDEINETRKIGAFIRRLRLQEGLTQSDLAEKLNVSYQQVQKYENGQTSLNIPRLKKIAAVLKVPVLVFLNEKGERDRVAESAESYGNRESLLLSLTARESQLVRLYRRIRKNSDREKIISLLKNMDLERKANG